MLRYQVKEVGGIRSALEGMRFAYKSNDKSWRDADLTLAQDTLNKAGNPHNKFLREIVVWVKITAPILWWKQADTYRMGFEKNSESTMHTIMKFPFKASDFGWSEEDSTNIEVRDREGLLIKKVYSTKRWILDHLNALRESWLEETDKEAKERLWFQLMDILPQSYLQSRMCMISYATLQKMYFERKDHKLPEWQQLLAMIDELPLGFLIKKEQFTPEVEIIKGFIDDLNDYRSNINDRAEDLQAAYGNQPWYEYLQYIKEMADTLLFYNVDLSKASPSFSHFMDAVQTNLIFSINPPQEERIECSKATT